MQGGGADQVLESDQFPHVLTFYRTDQGLRGLVMNGS
jgi:hypothetical protein